MIDEADLTAEARDGEQPTAFSRIATRTVDQLIAATGGGPSAAFDFHHKVFAFPGARFAIDRRARATMFYMHLGNLNVSLTPAVLRREFNIAPHSHDCRLIDLADKALSYVKEVRPGDSIPKELVDGSASWSVEDRHYRLATARLLAEASAWFTPDKRPLAVDRILAMSDDDEAAKADFNRAFLAIAHDLGLEDAGAVGISEQIDGLARELCYIEALREHADHLRSIREKVLQLACAAKADKKLVDELTRVLTLLKQPLTEFVQQFAQIDAQTSELLTLLRGPWLHIKRIRDARDHIHAGLMPWSEIFERWRDQEVIFNRDTYDNVHSLHRWLAARYSPTQVWQ